MLDGPGVLTWHLTEGARPVTSIMKFRHSPNSAELVLCHDGKWVEKQLLGGNQFLAEAFAWVLARALQLPVPNGRYRAEAGALYWQSCHVSESAPWQKGLEGTVNPRESLVQLVLLDAVVANPDRSVSNVLLVPVAAGSFDLKLIDHDVAVCGDPDAYSALGTAMPAITASRPVRGLPKKEISGMLGSAAEPFRALTTRNLELLYQAAATPLSPPLPESKLRKAAEAAFLRCQDAEAIAVSYLGSLP